MRGRLRIEWTLAVAVGALLLAPHSASAATRLKSICRVKGQEENTLHGLGLVVGLNGTGDGGSFLPAIRSLASALQLFGSPIGPAGPAELKDARNVALVSVTATVPAAGARQGDQLNCVVSSVGSAKSLAGGRLLMTPLLGPQVHSERVYAFAEGLIQLDDPRLGNVGRIHRGCRLEEDFFNVFSEDGFITLVLESSHADFEIAQEVAMRVNGYFAPQTASQTIARAVNQQNVEVRIPSQYLDDPVNFVSQVLRLEIELEPELQTDARVVINQRAGSVVIDGNVTIGPVAITHKNIVVETGEFLGDRWVPVSPGEESPTHLKALVESLNAVKVPTADIIEVIKNLERSGKLHGRVIIE